MKDIQVSDHNFRRLQELAMPFVDSPNDVVGRLLDQFKPGGLAERDGPGAVIDAGHVPVQRGPRTTSVLYERGLIGPGTMIVVAPARLPSGVEASDAKYAATFVDANRVVWGSDGQRYSLSALTAKLRDQHGILVPRGELTGPDYWALASNPSKTLWDLREDILGNQQTSEN